MSKFETKRVSDQTIKVHKLKDNQLEPKGKDWFSIVYSNIFLLAKKHSGKTTIIENILKKCSGVNTQFLFIASTINKDPSWIRIVKYWSKSHDVDYYDELFDDEGNNIIDNFINEQKSIAEENVQSGEGVKKIQPNQPIYQFKPNNNRLIKRINQIGGQLENKVEKQLENQVDNLEKKKSKLIIYPEFIIVIDDMGDMMRNPSIAQLLKTNRHYKAKVILSGQNITDLAPSSIRQLDYCLVFQKQPDEKILKLRENLGLTISKEDFLELYKNATEKPYSFLYIGRLPTGDIFRKSFNDEYLLTD
jgi:hypothetical protein